MRTHSRSLASLALAVAVGTAGLVTFSSPASAGGPLSQRDICIPLPGLPCLPDLPIPIPGTSSPVAQTPVAITGTPKVDETLTATPPTWDDTPPLVTTTTTYQWNRDGVAIPDATSTTYVLLPSDVDKQLTVVATGSRPLVSSTDSVSAAVTGLIGDAPEIDQAPAITGTVHTGQTLTTTNGTYKGEPPPQLEFTYQWYRSTGGKSVAKIDGATAKTYAITVGDAGRRLAVVIVAEQEGHEPTTSVAVAPGKVNKLGTELAISLASSSIRKGERGKVDVLLTGEAGTAAGKVVIREGSKKVGKARLDFSDSGVGTVTLRKLGKGIHDLVATYQGSAAFARTTSNSVRLTVTR